MTTLKIMISEITLNIKEMFSYKMNFINDILIFGLLYIFLIFFDTGVSLGMDYGGNANMSKSLLLIGYVMWTMAISPLNILCNEVRIEAYKGTLEQKFMAVIPFYWLLIGKAISGIIIYIFEISIIIIISKIFMGIEFFINLKIISVIFVMMIGMYGIALILGGLTLKEKKIGNIMLIIQIFLLYGGNVLSKSTQIGINKFIPLSVGIDLARRIITNVPISKNEFTYFLLLCVLWFVLGIFIFKYFSYQTKKEGLLNNY